MEPIPTLIDNAINAYNAALAIPGIDPPKIRALAREFTVPLNTLAQRISGITTSRSVAFTHLQALSVGEEEALVDYIRRTSLLGNPPTCQLVCETAEAIRKNRVEAHSGPLGSLGKHWLDRFRKRHPEISTTWTRQLDTARHDATTTENVAPWFAEMGTMIDRHHYKPENIYNMDETGFGIGLTQSTRVLVIRDGGKRSGKKATKATSGRQEWVTSIECVSASGQLLPPLVIFTALGSLNARWLPDNLEVAGWRWTTSTKGWTNNTLSFDWLVRVFHPCTTSSSFSNKDIRRLLIVDGHGSHITARFIAFCIIHKIDLMLLPSHTSAVTQPLDVGVFGPLKAAMARWTDQFATYDHGRIPKDVWASHLADCRVLAMTKHNILVGWRETGLHPFRPDRVLNKLTSNPTSTSSASRPPLAALPINNRDFLLSCDASPMKDHIITIIKQAEAAQADASGARAKLMVLERENKGLRDAAEIRKRKRISFTVKSMGTHIFTQEEVLKQKVMAEAATASRKGKGKGKAGPAVTRAQ